MNRKYIILIIAVIVSGCGPFKHHQKTYYIDEVSTGEGAKSRPILRVQIVPTVTSMHIPLFYYSRTWGEPYSISFSADSRVDVCTHFVLKSFRFTSNGEVIEEKVFSTPLKLNLCGAELGFKNNHTLYRYELDDSFVFSEGRKVELEVRYERPDGMGVRTVLFHGVGSEEKDSSSLLSAYMGV